MKNSEFQSMVNNIPTYYDRAYLITLIAKLPDSEYEKIVRMKGEDIIKRNLCNAEERRYIEPKAYYKAPIRYPVNKDGLVKAHDSWGRTGVINWLKAWHKNHVKMMQIEDNKLKVISKSKRRRIK